MSTKDFSSVQEKSIASELGWSVVSGSGSRPNAPGDVSSDRWLGECKTHTSPGHRIIFVRSVWGKILDEAASRFKFAVLFVDDGSQKLSNTWCLFNVRPVMSDVNSVSLNGDNANPDFHKLASINSKSISFDCQELRDADQTLMSKSGLPTVFYITEGRKLLYVTSLSTFKSLFAGE